LKSRHENGNFAPAKPEVEICFGLMIVKQPVLIFFITEINAFNDSTASGYIFCKWQLPSREEGIVNSNLS
jgi:hypothetical protein